MSDGKGNVDRGGDCGGSGTWEEMECGRGGGMCERWRMWDRKRMREVGRRDQGSDYK